MFKHRFAILTLAAIFFSGSSAALIQNAVVTAPVAGAHDFTLAQVDQHRLEERRRLERQRLERQRLERQRLERQRFALNERRRRLEAQRRAELERQRHHDRGRDHDRH
jgi:membrane protein involved in colicin uptake